MGISKKGNFFFIFFSIFVMCNEIELGRDRSCSPEVQGGFHVVSRKS